MEKKKKKKKRTYWRKVCMGYWVVTAEQTQKVHQEKKKTGQIIILFRLIKGVKNDDVPRSQWDREVKLYREVFRLLSKQQKKRKIHVRRVRFWSEKLRDRLRNPIKDRYKLRAKSFSWLKALSTRWLFVTFV